MAGGEVPSLAEHDLPARGSADSHVSTTAVLLDREVQVDTVVTKRGIHVDAESGCKEQLRLIRQSRFLAVGAVGIFSAYSGVCNLQSSLNFDESVGTASLAIAFATTILMNAAVVPLLFQYFCVKTLLLISEFTFIVFTFANLCSEPYSLYPGAILLGIGQSIVWPSITMFNSYLGTQSADCTANEGSIETSGKKYSDHDLRQLRWNKVRWFTGKFFVIFAFYQILGNLMAYAILVLDSKRTESHPNVTAPNSTNMILWNDTSPSCGAKDCYEYDTPVLEVDNVALKYALFVGYGVLQIVAMIFHKVTLVSVTYMKDIDSKARPAIKDVCSYVTQILRHMTSPLQILLAPLNIYNGLMMAFLFGDFTRSYVSCVLGVKEVGLAMTFFGVSNALGSLCFQWYSGTLGRLFFVVLCIAAEAGLLVFSAVWEPTVTSPWEVYLLAACFGFPDSLRQNSLAATYPEYFAGKENSAFSTLSLLTATGYVIMFGIGTSVCVFNKIVLLLFALLLGLVCYIAAEYGIYRRGSCYKNCRNTVL